MIKTINAFSFRMSRVSTLDIDLDGHELIYKSGHLVYIDESIVKDTDHSSQSRTVHYSLVYSADYA